MTSATVIDGEAGSADDGSGGVDYANLLALEYGVDFGYLIGNEGEPETDSWTTRAAWSAG